MSEIFISYRRGADSPYARGIYDRLAPHFGRDKVFMDIDTMEPGIDFVDYIHRAVASCDVLVAVIGRDWISALDEHGQRRLDDEDDFVRQEVSAALDREDVRVIPVLVGGAAMPARPDLPGKLGDLRRRNALELSDSRWRYDVGLLIDAVEKIVGPAQPQPAEQQVEEPPPAAKSAEPAWAPEPAAPEPRPAPTPTPPRRESGSRNRRRILAGLAGIVVLGAAVAGIAAALGGGGWGGDSKGADSGRLTHAQLVSQVGSVCNGSRDRLTSLTQKKPSSAAATSQAAGELADVIDEIGGKLRRLRPPAEDEKNFNEYVAAYGKAATDFRQLGDAIGNGTTAQDLQQNPAAADLQQTLQKAHGVQSSLGLSNACNVSAPTG